MTINIDLADILIAVVTCAVSVLATWLFSKRHYTRASRRQAISDNEITLQEKQNEFRFNVVLLIVLLLAFAMVVGGFAYCATETDYWDRRSHVTDGPRNAAETQTEPD